jgi:hypothetical protein
MNTRAKLLPRLIGSAVLLAASDAALAHIGPRVWIGNEAGRIVTYTSNNDLAPTSYAPQKLFIGGADEDSLAANGRIDEYPVSGTDIFATEFPGFQVRLDRAGDGAGGGLSFGTTIAFKIAGPLLVFDPARMVYRTSAQAFGSPGPAPQFGFSVPGGTSGTAVTGDGPVNGFDFLSYDSASDHAHLVTALLPEGVVPPAGTPPGDGPHVVYAVPLVLTAPGYQESHPFCILYGRDITYPDDAVFLDALHVAQISFGLPGDANLDQRVDITDLGTLATNWQQTGFWTDGDFNFDGLIDITDLGLLATNWQRELGSIERASTLDEALSDMGLAGALAPEPSAPFLAALALFAALSRRTSNRPTARSSHCRSIACSPRGRRSPAPSEW